MLAERAAEQAAAPTSVASSLHAAFRDDVLSGLLAKQRAIPARWLYDHHGSTLFEAITALPEYYPTRTERAILSKYAPRIASLVGPYRAVVEFGSGSSLKTPVVLAAIAPASYIPVDISEQFLKESVEQLSKIFPTLPIHPVVADFMQPLQLAGLGTVPALGFFPGSTIGNLVAPTAIDLLRRMAKALGSGAHLLIGIDRIKSTEVLMPAYDDAQGITARFNLNVLERINRELGGDVPIEVFRHMVRWNEPESRIEMHLEASRAVSFQIAGVTFRMDEGETIHTENSVKYGPSEASLLLRAGGWTPVESWTDEEELFAVILAEVTQERSAP